MIAGIILIGAGILIAVYPKLLSIIVASILIFIGTSILLLSLRFRRASRQWENPFVKFFMRF